MTSARRVRMQRNTVARWRLNNPLCSRTVSGEGFTREKRLQRIRRGVTLKLRAFDALRAREQLRVLWQFNLKDTKTLAQL